MEHAKLQVEPMHCGGCVNRVAGLLRALPGVKVRNVSLGSAELGYDPAATSLQRIVEVLADKGYTARSLPQ